MTCAADGQDRIVSVQEVQVCRYRLMFASSKLCKLDEFARPDEKAQEIVCWYADDEEAAEVEAAEKEAAETAAAAKRKPPPPPPPPPPPTTPAAQQASAKSTTAGKDAAAAAASAPANDCADEMGKLCGAFRGKGQPCTQCTTRNKAALDKAGCKPSVLAQVRPPPTFFLT